MFSLLACVFSSALVFLMNAWSWQANSFIAYSKPRTLEAASHVMISVFLKKQHTTKRSIQTLFKDPLGGPPFFEYKKKKFVYNSERKTFEGLAYQLAEPFAFYKA